MLFNYLHYENLYLALNFYFTNSVIVILLYHKKV